MKTLGYICGGLLTVLLLPALTSAQTSHNTLESLLQQLAQLQAQLAVLGQQQGSGTTQATTPRNDAPPNLLRNLYRGIRGNDVIELQKFLRRTGDFTYPEFTTNFGALTEAAVRKFQCRVMHICSGTAYATGYGVVGPATRRAIQNYRFTVLTGTTTATNTTNTHATNQNPYAQGSYTQLGSYSQGSYTQNTYSQGSYTSYAEAAYYTQGAYYAQGSYAPAIACTPKSLSATSQNLVTKYDYYDQIYNNGMGYTNNNNLAGLLAHSESHWMDSYVVMFKATNDPKYLKKAIQHADIVLSKRDNNIGVTNWRGESLGIWSRDDHSGTDAGPFPHLVELGLITAPIAEIAALIKTTPCLQGGTLDDGRTLDSVANTYIAAVQEVDSFNHQDWHTDTRDGNTIGWYTTPLPESPWNNFFLPFGKPPPVNYVTAFAETLAHMYKATGDASYRDRARAIGYWVLAELIYDGATDSSWHYYWPKMPYYPDNYTDDSYDYPEDFGHLAYTAGFIEAMIAYNMGVFDSSVTTRLAHAMTRLMYQPTKGGFVLFMNGTGNEVSTHYTTAPYWAGFYLFLRPWDSGIVPAVEHALFTQKDIANVPPSTEGMFSLAQYIWYKQ